MKHFILFLILLLFAGCTNTPHGYKLVINRSQCESHGGEWGIVGRKIVTQCPADGLGSGVVYNPNGCGVMNVHGCDFANAYVKEAIANNPTVQPDLISILTQEE